jgi:hypothetical protein
MLFYEGKLHDNRNEPISHRRARKRTDPPDIRQLLVNRKSASRTTSWSSVSFAMSSLRISSRYLTCSHLLMERVGR